jgi:hypothetical protein
LSLPPVIAEATVESEADEYVNQHQSNARNGNVLTI